MAAKIWGITATIVTGANAATFLACRTERNALRIRVGRKPVDYIDGGCDNRLVSEMKKICGSCSRPVAGISS